MLSREFLSLLVTLSRVSHSFLTSLSQFPPTTHRKSKMKIFQKLCFVTFFTFLTISNLTFSYKFTFNSFNNTSNLIQFHGNATYESGALSLTQDKTPFSHGQALFLHEIPFKPSSSFKTSFTFSITPHHTNPIPAHGLAFFITPQNDATSYSSSGLGYLSLLNRTNNGNPRNHLFAIEFDVFRDKSLGDINDNHVGIDVNSVNSVVSEKAGHWIMTRNGWLFKELKLSSGDKYKAWIEYNSDYKAVTVTIAYAHLKKPNRPLIEAKVDLSMIFREKMYVGFAGSMGHGVERHEIWDWSFQNANN